MSSHTKNLAIYLRISTEKQSKNTSKETQLKVINEYISNNNIKIDKQFIYEDKQSASRRPKGSSIDDERISTRKGLNDLIFDARLKKFDTVMVYSHDRFTRNVQEAFLLKFLFDKLNIEVIYCRPGEDTNSENKKINDFFESLLNNLSQLESNMIGSRARLGNSYNIKNNYWAGGPPPYGYALQKIYPGSRKSILKICYSEARIVMEIFNLYLQGFSPQKIADIIKDRYKDNTDRKWTKNTIVSIVKNEDYTGVMVWDKKGGVRNPVKHQNPIRSKKFEQNVIIEDELWKQIEKVRSIHRDNPKYFSSRFLLKGFLICGKCKKPMGAKNNGAGKSSVYYCMKEKAPSKDSMKKKGIWEASIKADFIENKVINELGLLLSSLIMKEEYFNSFYERYEAEFFSRKAMYKKQINELSDQIEENSTYILNCLGEIANIDSNLSPTNKEQYEKGLDFIESLQELHSYLCINNKVLSARKEEAEKRLSEPIKSRETIKDFLLEKNNVFENIEKSIEDKEAYRRNLKMLMYDLIDKIVVSDDNVEIILK